MKEARLERAKKRKKPNVKEGGYLLHIGVIKDPQAIADIVRKEIERSEAELAETYKYLFH